MHLILRDARAAGLVGRNVAETVISTPKTGTGRLIDLDTETTQRFAEHQERREVAAERLQLVNPDRFVFLTPNFAPVRPDYLSERFLRISAHLGLPRIRFSRSSVDDRSAV